MGDQQEEKGWDELSINERLNFLKMKVAIDDHKAKGTKLFKVPFGIKMKARGSIKKNKVLVFYIQRNKGMTAFFVPIVGGLITVGSTSHNASSQYIFYWKNIPTLIVAEWSANPMRPAEFKDDTAPQTIIIRAMEAREHIEGKKIGGKTMIWVLIAVGVGAYLLFGSGGGG